MKTNNIILYFLMICLFLQVSSGSTWIRTGANPAWHEPGNWNLGVPGQTDDAVFDYTNYAGNPVLSCEILQDADCGFLFVGPTSDVNEPVITKNGTLTVHAGAQALILGRDAGSAGMLILDGGNVAVPAGYAMIGNAGTGNLHVISGQLTSTGNTFSGNQAGSLANITMDGGVFKVSGGQMRLPQTGTANLTINNGKFDVDSHIFGGVIAGSTLNITMSGGELVSSTGRFLLGHRGTAVMDMSGGAILLSGDDLTLGNLAGSGTLNMSGGTIEAPDIYIGNSGTGTLNMTGGIITSIGTLGIPLSESAVGSGEVYLFGGTIDVSAIDITDGFIEMKNTGTLIVAGNQIDLIGEQIGLGNLRAYSGRNPFVIVYDDVQDVTVVTVTVPNLNQAWNPAPQNYAVIPSSERTGLQLSWLSGDGAVQHDVYFGQDPNEVLDATASTPGIYAGRISSNLYTIPTTLVLGQTYYWRIDEVDGANQITEGTLWQFSVSDYISVDDFESYGDVTSVWAGSSSLNTDPEWSAEGTNQSMVVDYDTTVSPYGKSVVRTFQSAQDWTEDGVAALRVYFRTSDQSAGDVLTITLEDNTLAAGSAAIQYGPDVNDIVTYIWDDWNVLDVALADFTGVELDQIKKMTLTLGDNSPGGGSGSLYVDEIRLYIPRCLADRIDGDVTGDCVSDTEDLNVFIENWLESQYTLNQEAVPVGPFVHYNFEETDGKFAYDSSGNDYDATASLFSATWAPSMGPDGSNCVEFDGFYGFDVDPNAFDSVQPDLTISVWLKGDHPDYPGFDPVQQMRVFQGVWTNAGAQTLRLNAAVPWTNYTLLFNLGGPGGYGASVLSDSPADFEGRWNHYAFVRSVTGRSLKLYKNGILIADDDIGSDENLDLPAFDQFAIASLAHAGGTIANYVGYMDDFRMYDYELSYGQILTLAGVAEAVVPVDETADIVADGIINLQDFAAIGEIWLSDIQLWPN